MQNTLLPLDQELDLGGRSLRIEREIGQGLTAVVYRGYLLAEDEDSLPTPVAVKAQRPGLPEQARGHFDQESLALGQLRGFEEEANKQQRSNFRVAPDYYGRGDCEGIAYLVMEFIEGLPLSSLLAEQEDGRLPELPALTIGWHLFRALDIVHRRLRKSAPDLRLSDLYWISTPDGNGQLKWIDWGTLADAREGSQAADRLRAAVFIGAILTGHYLHCQKDRLLEPAAPHLAKVDMSWGTRQLMGRLLHRHLPARPQNAAEVMTEFRMLVNFWQRQPPSTLLDIAEANLSRAAEDPLSDKGREYAVRARAALDIARRLLGGAEQLQEMMARADDILAGGDYLARGQALYRQGAYRQAQQVFEEGRYWNDNPAELRRWAYVALIGDEVPSAIYDQYRAEVLAAVERLNEGQWAAALDRLAALAPYLPGKGLAALQADARLFLNLELASQGDLAEWGGAADYYRQAQMALAQLPDYDFIRQEEVNDLDRLVEEQDRLKHSGTYAAHRMTELLAEAEWRENLDEAFQEQARQAFALDRGNVARQEELQRLVEIALRRSQLQAAVALTATGPEIPALARLGTLARQVQAARESLRQPGAGDRRHSLATLRGVLPHLTSYPALQPAILELLAQAGRVGLEAGDAVFLEEVISLAQQLPDSKPLIGQLQESVHRLERQRREELGRRLDQLFAQIETELVLVKAELTRFLLEAGGRPLADLELMGVRWEEQTQAVAELTETAVRLATQSQYRSQEAETLQQQVRGALEKGRQDWQNLVKQRQQEVESRRQTLQKQRSQMEKLLRQRTAAEPAPGRLRSTPEQEATWNKFIHLNQQLAAGLSDLLVQAQIFLAEVDAGDEAAPAILKWAREAFPKTGAAGYQTLLAALEQRQLEGATTGQEQLFLDEVAVEANQQAQHLARELEAARTELAQGHADEAMARFKALNVNHRGAPELVELERQIQPVQQWQKWQEKKSKTLAAGLYDATLLDEIRHFAYDLDVTHVYFQDSPAAIYLRRLQETAPRQAKESFIHRDEEGFLTAVQSWLDVEWMADQAQLGPPRPRPGEWQAGVFLEGAAEAAVYQDFSLVEAAVHQAPVPAVSIPAALAELTSQAWRERLRTADIQRRQDEANRQWQKRRLAVIVIGLALVILCFTAGSMALFLYGQSLAVLP